MHTHFKTSILLGESEQMDRMMQAFRAIRKDTATSEAWLGLIIFMAVLTVLALLTFISHWRQRQRKIFSPRKLFFEICRAHRLKWSERRLLWRLARSQKLEDPAVIFLTPECFDIARLTVDIRPQAEDLRELRGRLFAESAEKVAESQTKNGGRPTLGKPELQDKTPIRKEIISPNANPSPDVKKAMPRGDKNFGAELPLPQIPPTLDLPQWNAGRIEEVEI